MKAKGILLTFAALLALLGVALQFGCEGTGDVDTGDVDSYFASHPYVSDPRGPTSPSDIVVSPTSATVSYPGQTVTFIAKGGSGSYHWDVVNGNGHIGVVSQEKSTSSATYITDVVELNTVVVYDQYGHSAVASVNYQTAGTLAITPSSATITNLLGTVQFAVVGGTSPFHWTVTDGSIGEIDSPTGNSITYRRIGTGGNSVRVQDAAGFSASAAINQP